MLEVLGDAKGMMTGDGLYTAVAARVVYRSQKLKYDQTPFYTGLAHAGHEGGGGCEGEDSLGMTHGRGPCRFSSSWYGKPAVNSS